MPLLGSDIEVPCADGINRRYVNLDYAASTPVMRAVWDAVEAFVPFYSSVHRGTGAKSRISTEAYEHARDTVAALRRRAATAPRSWCATRPRRSTSSPRRCRRTAASSARRSSTTRTCSPGASTTCALIPFPHTPAQLLDDLERALKTTTHRRGRRHRRVQRHRRGVAARRDRRPRARYGAQLFVDAAQLAPHREIDMEAIGHRPPRALRAQAVRAVRRRARSCQRQPLDNGDPLIKGGGAVKLVTVDDVLWVDGPERYEAGSPNVIGAVALGRGVRRTSTWSAWRPTSGRWPRACTPGWTRSTAWTRSRCGPATRTASAWPRSPSKGWRDTDLAQTLSDEFAIGVRHGCFCAHPLLTRLLNVSDQEARTPARAS